MFFPLSVLACGGEIQKPDALDSGALEALSVAAVTPDEGPVGGGTGIEIAGAGFTWDTTTVSLDGAACADLTYLSAELLACTTPPGNLGAAELQVARQDDGAAATATFTYREDAGGTDSGGTDGGAGDSGVTDTDPADSDPPDTDPPAIEGVDYCHLQWPCAMTVAAEAASEAVYCWVYESGVTEGPGAGAGVTMEVGYGADGTDPAAGDWVWSAMDWLEDVEVGGGLSNDLYDGGFTAPRLAGDYDYACRASVDGDANWTYCDAGDDGAGDGCGDGLLGSSDGYAPGDAGQLTVE